MIYTTLAINKDNWINKFVLYLMDGYRSPNRMSCTEQYLILLMHGRVNATVQSNA